MPNNTLNETNLANFNAEQASPVRQASQVRQFFSKFVPKCLTSQEEEVGLSDHPQQVLLEETQEQGLEPRPESEEEEEQVKYFIRGYVYSLNRVI